MKCGESGFSLIEVIVASCLAGIIGVSAASVTYQAMKDTERTNRHMAVFHHGEMAATWINRDCQMADGIDTDSLTPPAIIILSWAEWGYGENSVFHSVTYSVEDVTNGIGKLMRTHTDSLGNTEQKQVAEHIYYDTGDPTNSTAVSYSNHVLTLKIVTRSVDAEEVKEYTTYRRPNYVAY